MFLLPWGGKEGGQNNLSDVYSLPPPIRVTFLNQLTYAKRDELGFQIQVSNDIQALLSQTSSRKKWFFFSLFCSTVHISFYIILI